MTAEVDHANFDGNKEDKTRPVGLEAKPTRERYDEEGEEER